jgi:glycine cleavage system aminomethyltransferase T
MYLPLELARAGVELEVQVMGESVKAKVANLALVDPKGEKLGA